MTDPEKPPFWPPPPGWKPGAEADDAASTRPDVSDSGSQPASAAPEKPIQTPPLEEPPQAALPQEEQVAAQPSEAQGPAEANAVQESQPPRPALDASVPTKAYDSLKRRVKAALEQNVASDETITVIIRGAHGQAMVGTERRVFVCKPGFMAGASFGAEVTTWSYQNLLGVQAHKGMVSGAVVLQGPGQTGVKTSYWGGGKDDPSKAPNAIPIAGDWPQVNAGVARLRQLIDDAHRPTATGTSTPIVQAPLSTADELRKLADLRAEGILSDEEFEAAKARLLSG